MEELLAVAYQAFEGELQNFEDCDTPIWILGNKYDPKEGLDAVKEDILSRTWLTYRHNFPDVADGVTSDRGWGCMLRCGQMVLAEAICRKHLGRPWRWSPDCTDATYLKLLAMFEDHPLAPFSLHVMARLGAMQGKPVGEWFGPNTVAHLINRLPEFDVWNNFAVSVASNNIFIIEDTKKLCKKSPNKAWNPLLLIIPLRLGMDILNPIYIQHLQKYFHMPECLGILGGTPSHALFLIGYVGDEVVYLDPHTTQDSTPVGNKETEEQRKQDLSYHCQATPRMLFSRLDPSMALCFLCNTEAEFDTLCARLRTDLGNSLFEVMDKRPAYMDDTDDSDTEPTQQPAAQHGTDELPGELTQWYDCRETSEAAGQTKEAKKQQNAPRGKNKKDAPEKLMDGLALLELNEDSKSDDETVTEGKDKGDEQKSEGEDNESDYEML